MVPLPAAISSAQYLQITTLVVFGCPNFYSSTSDISVIYTKIAIYF